MPGFICSAHGNTYMTHVCPHIRQGVASGSLPEKIITLFVNYGELWSSEDPPLIFKYFYCLVCAGQYGLPPDDTVLTGEEFESSADTPCLPHCAECFREALNNGGIIVGAAIRVGDGPIISDGEA
jgi:hypothetical protein